MRDDYNQIRSDRTAFGQYWRELNAQLESAGLAPVTQGPAHRAWTCNLTVSEAVDVFRPVQQKESKP